MKKLYSILMLSMFIIGMLPAAIAQEDTDSNLRIIGADRIGAQQRAPVQRIGATNNVEPVKLRPVSGMAKGRLSTENGRIDTDAKGIERVENDLEKTRRDKHYKSLVKTNKGRIKGIFNSLKENYDEEKAIKFVTFAAHVNEKSIDVIEGMINRAEDSPNFLENHPDALDKMEEIRGELYASYDVFYNAVSDEAISEEEYRALTDELRAFGQKLNSLSKNDQVRAFAKEHREQITNKLRNRYGDSPKVKASIERLERSENSDERLAAMEEVRTSIVEVSGIDNEISEELESESEEE